MRKHEPGIRRKECRDGQDREGGSYSHSLSLKGLEAVGSLCDPSRSEIEQESPLPRSSAVVLFHHNAEADPTQRG